jgi:hypothetical protein
MTRILWTGEYAVSDSDSIACIKQSHSPRIIIIVKAE